MKAMYREDDGRLTEFGLVCMNEAERLLQPPFDVEEASPNEVAAVLHSTIEELRCETLLNADDQRAKDKATAQGQLGG